MDKKEAMKISVQLLLRELNNYEVEVIELPVFIHTVEAEKDYTKILSMVEKIRNLL